MRNRHECKCSEPACPVEDDVHKTDATDNRQRHEHDVADHIHVVAFAKLRRGRVFGEVEGEHTEETEDRKRECDHAGDQAVTSLQCAMAFGEFV